MNNEMIQENTTSAVSPSQHHLWRYVVAIGLVVLMVVTGWWFFRDQNQPQTTWEMQNPGPKRGAKQPVVTIVMYSDFQCPFCKSSHPAVNQMLDAYGEFVAVEYRHFPLFGIHPRSVPAAVASECAKEQGVFWQFYDIVFEHQDALSDKNLLSYAKQAGANADQFWACYSSQKYLARVNADYESGLKKGVSATPTFFVNGKKLEGALPFEDWQKIMRDVFNLK